MDFELGFEVRSASNIGGWGDFGGREWWDICDDDLEAGKDDREVLLL